jgi:peroxidase
LDEEFFPGTTVPKSSLIISLFSLFGMGNSDRFNTGFSLMRCLLVDQPWDCKPSNALDELLWKSTPKPGFPNFRTLDEFWMKELDLPSHGSNLLWRLVTENSDIKCLQKDPLWPLNDETNPLMCSLPEAGVDILATVVTGIQVVISWLRQHAMEIVATIVSSLLAWIIYKKR